MDSLIAAAGEIAERAERELDALVAISSPSGDLEGAEQAIALCTTLLPEHARAERVTCSTPGSAADLVATVSGSGSRRILLLGHLDTVIAHESHAPLRRDGERLYGPGSADMKGGVVLSLGVARALAERPETFAELTVLLVTDEEWRTAEFVHARRFAGYDACLCFEAGQLTPDGDEAVVVRRKAAGTLRVTAIGRAAHSGSAPDQGRNALLGLAHTATALAGHHNPSGARPSQRRADRDSLGRRVQRRPRRRGAVVRHASRLAWRRSRRCWGRSRPSSRASGSKPGWSESGRA